MKVINEYINKKKKTNRQTDKNVEKGVFVTST